LTNYQKQQNIKIENLPSEWLIYNEMSQHGYLKCLKCCTHVSSLCVGLFGGNIKLNEKYLNDLDTYKSNECLKETLFKIDSLGQLKSTNYDSSYILNLRQKWNCLFLRRMKYILSEWTNEDHVVLETLVNVLLNEDYQTSI
jgi:ATP-dependent RNA helicase YTHDC2